MGHGFGSRVVVFMISALLIHVHQSESSYARADTDLDGCDLFQGRWVRDETPYPLYNTSTCPFIEKEFDCQANGRPDDLYLKYRWKPAACHLPTLDGESMLRKLRGKKVLFVGDSLSLNQCQSFTCILHAAVPESNFTISRNGFVSVFNFSEYNVSITLSRNAFLVDVVKEKVGMVLKLDSIENGNAWKGYDILIFNTWHWWLHKGSKQPWDYMIEDEGGKGKMVKDMNRLVAFKKGMTTWANWVDSNINSRVTRVFFQGISPTHYNGEEWNALGSTSCSEQTKPLSGSRYPGGTPPAVAVVKEVLRKMKTPVGPLDVTTLSQLRRDGHPSVYGIMGGGQGNDCSHWCLPGVPDTWNELLFALILQK